MGSSNWTAKSAEYLETVLESVMPDNPLQVKAPSFASRNDSLRKLIDSFKGQIKLKVYLPC